MGNESPRAATKPEPSSFRVLGYLWRISVLAFCFAAFGIGGIFFNLLLFPVMRLLPGDEKIRRQRARRVIGGCFAALVWTLRATGTMVLEVRNAERLRSIRHNLILANHPSYLDVVVLVALMPEVDCVVKQGLWDSPYFKGVVREARYISNADSDRLVDECANAITRGGALLIFPEGSRSVPGQPLAFQRGAARIALRANCEIVPVFIDCEPAGVWAKGFHLSHIARDRFHIKLEIKPPVRLNELGMAQGEPEPLAARRLTRQLENYFNQGIQAL